MTVQVEQLITEHLDLWTQAQTAKSTSGRGSNNKIELTGIKKLRELILELAVRGKLVPQDPNDEPASELLKRIAAEKEALVKAGKLKRQKPLPPITDEEKLFELPNGWSIERVGNLVSKLGSGSTPRGGQNAYVNQGIPFLRSQNVWNDGLKLDDIAYIDEETHQAMANTKVIPNDVLLNITGASLGRSVIFPKSLSEANVSQHVTIIRLIDQEMVNYFHLSIMSPLFQRLVWQRQVGMAIEGLSKKVLELFEFPVPPLAEQRRIGAKVNELMALCDQLEQQSYQQLDAHNQLVDALLATLTQSQNADELASNWQRLAAHFDTLFTTEYSIDALKQTILQLAVMGKLVKQDPNDEPASELLKRIAAEKDALVKAGKIKKQKPLPPINDDEKPFALPEGWEFSRIGTIASLVSGKGFKADEYSSTGARLLQIANVSLGYTKWDIKNFLPIEYLKIYPELELKIGDVLIALNRPLLNMKMKVCIISETDLPSILYQRVGKFFFYSESVSAQYFYFYLQSKMFINRLNEDLQGSDQPFINQSQVVDFVIPLPPIEEQKRIFTKAKELISICENLSVKINAWKQTSVALSDALVEQVVV